MANSECNVKAKSLPVGVDTYNKQR